MTVDKEEVFIRPIFLNFFKIHQTVVLVALAAGLNNKFHGP